MNYQEMSGYEINTRLHNVIECDNKFEIKVEGYRVTWTDRVTRDEIVTLRKQYDKSFKDYLGSWADAGPIAEENEIGLLKVLNGWCATNDHAKHEGVFFVDPNPRRAICIVFLMMKGGE